MTAALMNTHIRDQLRECSPFTVTTAGDLSYADAANSMNSRLGIGAAGGILMSNGTGPVWRRPLGDSRTDQAVGGASGDWRTLGGVSWYNDSDDVAVTVVTGATAIVMIKGQVENSTIDQITAIGYTVSGDSTVAAALTRSLYYKSGAAGEHSPHMGIAILQGGLTPGTNLFSLTGYIDGGQGTIGYPAIIVVPL
ncbi:MAG TPA: hypothetical protein VM118_03955 [Acidobacteriota bacterium]|nr:hypothetical protein [Acidobacteriota bacterium]